jgi:hypothetical protein
VSIFVLFLSKDLSSFSGGVAFIYFLFGSFIGNKYVNVIHILHAFHLFVFLFFILIFGYLLKKDTFCNCVYICLYLILIPTSLFFFYRLMLLQQS